MSTIEGNTHGLWKKPVINKLLVTVVQYLSKQFNFIFNIYITVIFKVWIHYYLPI